MIGWYRGTPQTIDDIRIVFYRGVPIVNIYEEKTTGPYRIPEIGSFSWQQPVLGILNTPPTNPQRGDRYLVGTNPTGEWYNRPNCIAYYNGSMWRFDIPKLGWMVYDIGGDKQYYFYYTGWIFRSVSLDSIDGGVY